MAKNNNLTDFLTDVADAIRAKQGTSAKINPQNFSSEIASIGGSATTTKSDVNFYDYDGTLLHSYSKAEFLALPALPGRPTREGLTCQGWNYDRAKARAYVISYGALDIGATYITDDGKTRLYIRIVAKGRMTVPLCFSQTVANGVTIDWGDGSATQTLTGTGIETTTHTYASIGDYIITLKVTSGTLGLGNGSSSYSVMGSTGNNGKVYCNMLQRVEIGSRVTSIGSYAFNNCYSLSSIVIPSSVTSIGTSTFSSCYSLSSIVIPSSVTSIGTSTFSSCYSLSSIVIPSSITSIGQNVFYNCYGMRYYDFRASKSVPTLSNTKVFYNIPSDCKIVVPDSLYSSWIEATNWSTYASKIVKTSEFNG